ncbi:MAG: isopentenyl-diphosphate Delta-isomerase [Candidatus Micrarchaeaceae archaeon]
MEQKVILVDSKDREVGLDGKMHAHMHGGKLHRAISIFVFNSNGETMLQQRAESKYHSKGLWSNTCCSHPFEGESTMDAARRRLMEEMGFGCRLNEAFSFIYHVPVGGGLTEYEFDHVLFGIYNRKPRINMDEVKDWRWIGMKSLKSEIKDNPDAYTPWLRILVKGRLYEEIRKFMDGR